MTNTHDITIMPNGEARFIWSDDLAPVAELGNASIERASHVEPTADGQWESDMAPVGGPVLGPFRLRSEALEAEVAYLKAMGY